MKKKRADKKPVHNTGLNITQEKRDQVASILAIMLGLLSMVEGGRVLLGLSIPGYTVHRWLVWYNVVMGGVSVIAGVGIWKAQEWNRSLAVNILALHAIVLVSLFGLKQMGQDIAMQSLFAMTFRTFTWIVINSLVRWKREKG